MKLLRVAKMTGNFASPGNVRILVDFFTLFLPKWPATTQRIEYEDKRATRRQFLARPIRRLPRNEQTSFVRAFPSRVHASDGDRSKSPG
jgi:hypothetical protein